MFVSPLRRMLVLKKTESAYSTRAGFGKFTTEDSKAIHAIITTTN